MFNFIKIGEVPKTSWRSEESFNLKPRLKTLMALVIGLILFGLGEALLVTSQIGVSPWTALGQGLANVSELGLGLTTFLISVVVLLLWIPLKQKPSPFSSSYTFDAQSCPFFFFLPYPSTISSFETSHHLDSPTPFTLSAFATYLPFPVSAAF